MNKITKVVIAGIICGIMSAQELYDRKDSIRKSEIVNVRNEDIKPVKRVKKDADYTLPGDKSKTVTQMFTFQGLLLDDQGHPVHGSVDILVKIYDQASGGNVLWEHTYSNTPCDSGYFSIMLEGIPQGIFSGSDRWLEIGVQGNILSPRLKIGSSPYAYRSDTSSFATASDLWDSHNWGDLYPNANATQIQGRNVSSNPPAIGQILKWDGNQWVPANDSAGGGIQPHNHFGEIWAGNSGTIGLVKKIDVNQSSAIYCEVDSALNSGSGATYGGFFYAGGTGGGNKYGVYGIAMLPSSSSGSVYAFRGVAFAPYSSSTTSIYGIETFVQHYGSGAAYGGRFEIYSAGTGTKYGIHCSVNSPSTSSSSIYGVSATTNHSGSGDEYGGRFSASGSGTGVKYGVYGTVSAPSSSTNPAYGAYGVASHAGSGTSYGGYFSSSPSGTGTKYGVYGTANASSSSTNRAYGIAGFSSHEGSAENYGGYFSAGGSGTGTKYGVYSDVSAPSSSTNPAYGAYCMASHAGSGTSYGGYFSSSPSGTGAKYGVYGTADASSSSTNRAYGIAGFSSHEGSAENYGGYFSASGSGTGVKYGVYGQGLAPSSSTNSAYGISGSAFHSGSGAAYGGRFYGGGSGTGTKYGVYSTADALSSSSTNPVYGAYCVASHQGTGTTYGAYCAASPAGTGTTYGGYFRAEGSGGGNKVGISARGYAPPSSTNYAHGVIGGASHQGSGDAWGGYFEAYGGTAGIRYGIYATASDGAARYAGYFGGNVNITGNLSVGGTKSFLIDHPLDPLNKTLRHNAVESPENLCLYRGKIRLDSKGEAIVEMPGYFVALTKEDEATVNLTPIGKPFLTGYEWEPGYRRFKIYGELGREVSYIVLADRDDPVIRKLRKPVVEEKGKGSVCEKGELIYPEEYGYPREMGRDYKIQKEFEKRKE